MCSFCSSLSPPSLHVLLVFVAWSTIQWAFRHVHYMLLSVVEVSPMSKRLRNTYYARAHNVHRMSYWPDHFQMRFMSVHTVRTRLEEFIFIKTFKTHRTGQCGWLYIIFTVCGIPTHTLARSLSFFLSWCMCVSVSACGVVVGQVLHKRTSCG